MYRHHYAPYAFHYPRLYPSYAEVALDVANTENRLLSRELSMLER